MGINKAVGFSESDILQLTSAGLYCPAGGFYIDPLKRVPLAVVTHAHSDHARSGMGAYVCSGSGEAILRERVGRKAGMTAIPFGKRVRIGKVLLSLHPAGHILGSAQVRIELEGRVAVVTGDHNATHAHPVAEAFEPVPCDLLITETTFGLPVYQWPDPLEVMEDIHSWWRSNQELGRTSVLPCYPLGKTQRILAALDPSVGPIAVAGPARTFLPVYAAAGVAFPRFVDLNPVNVSRIKGKGLLLISFAGREPPLLKDLQPLSLGAVSGWMQTRKMRRGNDADRGFVLSDHSDWEGLLKCIRASGARRVGVTHGETGVLSRYLREELGLESFAVPSRP
jgi:putative mRNA 3-end processing factor